MFADQDQDDNALDFIVLATPAPGSVELQPVPEPGTGLLTMAGLIALGVRRRCSRVRRVNAHAWQSRRGGPSSQRSLRSARGCCLREQPRGTVRDSYPKRMQSQWRASTVLPTVLPVRPRILGNAGALDEPLARLARGSQCPQEIQ
ncbi:MAG: PEP-CTERM sorting domain-containing protein [bacterium]|nr:PEP-CTERM sorting domain-containing protein [bacterium]